MKYPNLAGILLVFAITVGIWVAFVTSRSVELKSVPPSETRSSVSIFVSIFIGTIFLIAVNAWSILTLAGA